MKQLILSEYMGNISIEKLLSTLKNLDNRNLNWSSIGAISDQLRARNESVMVCAHFDTTIKDSGEHTNRKLVAITISHDGVDVSLPVPKPREAQPAQPSETVVG